MVPSAGRLLCVASLVGSLSAVLHGCAADTAEIEDGTSSEESGIIHGEITTAHPAVGHVDSCTATLVGRRTALTAAHCVKQGEFYPFCAGRICVGGTAYVHPDYRRTTTFRHDVAVLRLTHDFTERSSVEPVRLAATAPSRGAWLTLVGYGCSERRGEVGSGKKREGAAYIAAVDAASYQMAGPARICKGDSGGPSFNHEDSQCQVGVHSYYLPPILGSRDVDMRVDVHVPWILSVADDPSITLCGDSS
jgi:V8-like Glu-specific endopeptidase